MKRHSPCAHCGACLPVCPVYRVTGREDCSPRGRLRIIDLGLEGKRAARSIMSCLLCGACEDVCTRGLDITSRISGARKRTGSGLAARAAVAAAGSGAVAVALAPLAKIVARAANILPPESGLRLRLGLDAEGEKSAAPARDNPKRTGSPDGETKIFSGCLARYLAPEIETATATLERTCYGNAPAIPPGQQCCGLAAWSSGKLEQARNLARRNIEIFEGRGPILTPCASCYHQLKNYPAILKDDGEWHERAVIFAGRVRSFSRHFTAEPAVTALGNRLVAPPGKLTCIWHDPCHLRFGRDITREPRELLRLIPGLVLDEFSRGPYCCGMGGTFGINFPTLSDRIIQPAIEDLREKGTSLLVTSCSGCLLQWQRRKEASGLDLEVVHPAVLLADLLG